MAWNTPQTINPGDPLTASMWNAQVRDNVSYLLRPATFNVHRPASAGNLTTTSTSFTNITGFNTTLNIAGGHLEFKAYGYLQITGAGANHVFLSMSLDGGDIVVHEVSTPTSYVSAFHVFENIAPGNHNVALRWRVSAGTATLVPVFGFSVIER